jgi:hypothetical protein
LSWNYEFGIDGKKPEIDQNFDYVWFDCEVNPFTGKPFFNEIVFFHKPSGCVFMADVFWNYPTTSIPNYANIEGTGTVHSCSKVLITEFTLPEVQVPFGTKAWKFGMDKVYLPFYKRFMVGKVGPRRQKYDDAVSKVLQWPIKVIAPCAWISYYRF